MTGEERKRVLRLIFQELRADHGDDGRLVVKFKPRPEWESYIDAVLAKIAAGTASGTLAAIATSERETGLEPAKPRLWESRALPTELLPRKPHSIRRDNLPHLN